MNTQNTKNLESAFKDAIVELGVGGYVSTQEITSIFKEIDATTFAQIAYATDCIVFDNLAPSAVKDAAKIKPTIDHNNFEAKPHFEAVKEIFLRYFGSEKVKF